MSGKNSRRAVLRCTVSAAGLILGLSGGMTSAQAQSYTFDIPAQSLSASLRDYARVSGQQIIFTNDLVAGYSGRPLHGSYSPSEALSLLLSGTGLVVERSSSGALMIRHERHAAVDEPVLASTVMAGSQRTAAPEDPPAPAGVEQVVVSSTRLQNAGFDAPTPTTVVSSADIAKNAQPNVFDAITQLPALQGSTGGGYNTASTSTGLQGLDAIGLRGLSPLRTLVLLDGQRVVGANFNGIVDISQMPQMLISRVDVVTGGASASWGSDAVAGVVNFVTEKKFEGFKANVLGGISTYGDDGSATVQLAAGSSFLNGRGHIEAALEYSYTAGVQPDFSKNTSSAFGAVPNINGRNVQSQEAIGAYSSIGATPAGQPQYNFGTLTQNTSYASYGLITNGSKIGTTFNAAGQAVPYQYAGNCTANTTTGTLSGSIGGLCFGTPANPGDQVDAHQNDKSLIDPLTRGNFYTRASYDLTPSTEIYATVNLAEVRSENISAAGTTGRTGLSIGCNNAYLPSTGLFGTGLSAAATAAACAAAYPSGNFTFAT
jgi:iron complex outermembrane recepter protein